MERDQVYPAEALALRTLGAAELVGIHDARIVLAAGKPLALLVYLALAPGRRTSRESLIDLLWSDVDPDRARNALRQTLFQIRRLLGDEIILGSEELTLAAGITVDRDAFLAALDSGTLEAAVALYQGAFLPAFGVPGGAAFEQWADLERERLEVGFLRGAELLVRRHLNRSHVADARQLARRVRDLLPRVEAAGRLLLDVVVAGRDFVTAAMEANALEQWATSEGVVLEPSTRAAIARARRTVPAGTPAPDSAALVADLTGREREFFAITTAWDAVRTGPARHLHVSAPAGFGKSRLLGDAVARLEASGAPVVSLRGTPGDRDVPYAFAGDLAAALSALPGAAGVAPASVATLLALNPALSTRLSGVADAATGDEALRRRILALADLVHAVADEQRFVLAIDDLHWIDGPSYRVLEGVWGRLPRSHLLCLSASRPEREPAADACTRLPLAALTEVQVEALVSALAVVPTPASWSTTFAARLHEATHGSPLLVLETLRMALDQHILALRDNEWHCLDEARLAALLRAGEALRERIRALPPAQLHVLALLATAGTPLAPDVLAATLDVSRDALAACLVPLERHGLAMRLGGGAGGGLIPAHDEIAAAALAALPAAQRADVEREIGACVERMVRAAAPGVGASGIAGDPVSGIMRAVRHYAAAGDAHAVRRLSREYVQRARQRGDRRPFAALATELLGSGTAAPTAAALVRDLPVAWRLGLWSPARRMLAAAVAVLLPAAAWMGGRALQSQAAQRQRFVLIDSSGATREVPVVLEQWSGTVAPVTAAARFSTTAAIARRNTEMPPVISPDGRTVAWTEASGDSTTLDIWIRSPAGQRRLTRQRGDDVVTGWLPDGSALVGATDRWSTAGSLGYDIAVFDTATGAARPVSSGPAHDGGAVVSPDGTRAAFVRESDDFPPRACVAPIDGSQDADCRFVDDQAVARVIGWSGLDELVVIASGGDTRPLVAYDWARRTSRLLLGPYASLALLSPDRRWVMAALRIDGMRGTRLWIAPVDRPAQARPITTTGPQQTSWWEGRADSSAVIARLEFADTNRVLPLGMGTRLRVRPLTADNGEVPLRAPVTWSSSDTLVATVDTTGEVHPRRSGTTVISASLVRWRSARRTVRVVGEAPTTVLRETWDVTWPARWLAWGDPVPVVVSGGAAPPAMWNRGDGSYPSMAVLRGSQSARHGLGVEVRVATPITRTKWQHLRMALIAGMDTAALRAGDQQKAPPSAGRSDGACGISFPGSGTWGQNHLSVLGGIAKEIDLGELGAALRTGAWWTLRLQIFPDGRCGVAINGRVLSMAAEPLLLDGEFRLRLGDESADTRILFGPLQLWTGVRTDLDWTALAPR